MRLAIVKREDDLQKVEKQVCPLFLTLGIIGKKWAVPILQQIEINENKNYNFVFKQLRKVSSKTFCERIRELKGENIIERKVNAEKTPPTTSYSLTEKGRELLKIIHSLRLWNNRYNLNSTNIQCDKTVCTKCKLY